MFILSLILLTALKSVIVAVLNIRVLLFLLKAVICKEDLQMYYTLALVLLLWQTMTPFLTRELILQLSIYYKTRDWISMTN
mgnify:CR=1 FL=1